MGSENSERSIPNRDLSSQPAAGALPSKGHAERNFQARSPPCGPASRRAAAATARRHRAGTGHHHHRDAGGAGRLLKRRQQQRPNGRGRLRARRRAAPGARLRRPLPPRRRQRLRQRRLHRRLRRRVRRRGHRRPGGRRGAGHLRPLHPRRSAARLHRPAHRPGEERRRRAVDGDVDRDGGRRLRLGREQHRRGARPARLERDRDRDAEDPGRRLPGHAGQADRDRARHPALPAAAGAGRDPAGRRRWQPGHVRRGGHQPAAGAAQGRRKRQRPARRPGPDQHRDLRPGVDARAAAGAQPRDRLRHRDAHPGRAEGRGQGQGQGQGRPRRPGSRAG